MKSRVLIFMAAPEWALDEEELSSDSEGELVSSDSDSSSGEEVSMGIGGEAATCPVPSRVPGE